MQEVEDLLVQRGEGRLEGLHDRFAANEVVALDPAEELEDPRGARGGAVAELGVEGDAGEGLGLHRRPDLAFDERLGEQGEEVAQRERLDAVRGLVGDGGNLLGTLFTRFARFDRFDAGRTPCRT